MNSVQYVCLADWMWLHEKWCVRKLAFAPVWAPEETLVIVPTKESWGLFTYEEVQKNCTLHPLNGFEDEPVQGKVFRVEFKEMESFLRGQFYHTILKSPESWDVSIGTYDMATFMFLEPLLKDKIRFIGDKVNVEKQVTKMIKGD